MIKFSLSNGSFRMTMQDEHIHTIVDHLKKAKMKETGGILIGRYSDNLTLAEVTLVTGPPKDSKSGTTWFHRGTKGLKKLLNDKWKNQEFYIGEWHFHPNGSTTPSPQDLTQLSEISKSPQFKCPEPLMIIIAGTPINFKIQPYILLPNYGCHPLLPDNNNVD